MSIFDKILSDAILPPVLYHYTSPKCFTEIVESGYLYAANIRYIKNDISFSYTIEMVREELKRQIKSLKRLLKKEGRTDVPEKKIRLLNELIKRLASLEQFHIFIISFSQDSDLSSSWQDYCPGGIGLSIGFDTERLTYLAKRQGFKLVGCNHNKTEQERIVNALVSESIEKIKPDSKNASEWPLTLNTTADEFALKTIQMAAIFKHPSCSEKSEWRLFSMPIPILPTNSSIRFRGGESMLIPCLEFMLADKKDGEPPIKKIIIGPTTDKKLSRNSLELFMSANALKSCSILYSQIPYSESI